MFLFVLGIIATIVLFFVLGIEFTDDAVEIMCRSRYDYCSSDRNRIFLAETGS